MKKQKVPWVGAILYNDQGEVCFVQKNSNLKGSYSVLDLLHLKDHSADKESWSFPGGMFIDGNIEIGNGDEPIDNDEPIDIEVAEKQALDEVLEETGLEVDKLELLLDGNNIFDNEQKPRRGVLFVGNVSGRPKLRPEDVGEIHDAKWFKLSEIDQSLIKPKFKELLDRVRERIEKRLAEIHVGEGRHL
ncbi:MAG TPA: hypothetical protein DEB09_01330 [Candidatus Magasanikbacteria bacterium]|nr:hypothetical protein [Candidatus Magasanikbacteria bacterium]